MTLSVCVGGGGGGGGVGTGVLRGNGRLLKILKQIDKNAHKCGEGHVPS